MAKQLCAPSSFGLFPADSQRAALAYAAASNLPSLRLRRSFPSFRSSPFIRSAPSPLLFQLRAAREDIKELLKTTFCRPILVMSKITSTNCSFGVLRMTAHQYKLEQRIFFGSNFCHYKMQSGRNDSYHDMEYWILRIITFSNQRSPLNLFNLVVIKDSYFLLSPPFVLMVALCCENVKEVLVLGNMIDVRTISLIIKVFINNTNMVAFPANLQFLR